MDDQIYSPTACVNNDIMSQLTHHSHSRQIKREKSASPENGTHSPKSHSPYISHPRKNSSTAVGLDLTSDRTRSRGGDTSPTCSSTTSERLYIANYQSHDRRSSDPSPSSTPPLDLARHTKYANNGTVDMRSEGVVSSGGHQGGDVNHGQRRHGQKNAGPTTVPDEGYSPSTSPHSHTSLGEETESHTWTFEEQFKQLYELDNDSKRKEFLDNLFTFMQKRGTPVNRIPIMAKQTLDLYNLFKLVVSKGGLVEVINKKLWREITKGLHLPHSITSAAFTLRTQYMKYLYPYECEKLILSSPAELQAAIDGNRREGRRLTGYHGLYHHGDAPTLVSPQITLHHSALTGNGLSSSMDSEDEDMAPTQVPRQRYPSSSLPHSVITNHSTPDPRGRSPPSPKMMSPSLSNHIPSAAPSDHGANHLDQRSSRHLSHAAQERMAMKQHRHMRNSENHRVSNDEHVSALEHTRSADGTVRIRQRSEVESPPPLKRIMYEDEGRHRYERRLSNNDSYYKNHEITPIAKTNIKIQSISETGMKMELSGGNKLSVSIDLNGVTYHGFLYAQDGRDS